MIEEVEMKNGRIKSRQDLYYDQFVPHREQQSCCDEKASRRRQCRYRAVAYIATCTQSTGNPVRRVLGSVLVEM